MRVAVAKQRGVVKGGWQKVGFRMSGFNGYAGGFNGYAGALGGAFSLLHALERHFEGSFERCCGNVVFKTLFLQVLLPNWSRIR